MTRDKILRFEHGGDLEGAAAFAGCGMKELSDFSNLLNPQGPPPGLAEHLAAHSWEFLGHPSSGGDLRAKISGQTGVPEDRILLGAGTTEFIHLLPRVLRSQRPLILGPVYGGYGPALRAADAEPRWILAEEQEDWAFPSREWGRALAGNPDFVVFARPNNPPFASWPKAPLIRAILDHPDIFFMVDETCLEISDSPDESLVGPLLPPNVAVLRSFSKAYAAPGLRLGWAQVPGALAGLLRETREPWTVSPWAQAAGLFLLDQGRWLEASAKLNQKEKERVFDRLSRLDGFKAYPSPLPAFTVRGSRPGFSADRVLADLLKKERILIRSLGAHRGLGEAFFRIGLRTPAENDRLLRALEAVG